MTKKEGLFQKLRQSAKTELRRLPRIIVPSFFLVCFVTDKIEPTASHIIGAIIIWACVALITQLLYESYLTYRMQDDKHPNAVDSFFVVSSIILVVVVVLDLIFLF